MTGLSCETAALSTAQAGQVPRPTRAACIQARADLLGCRGAEPSQPGAREIVMAKGQMRSNKEKKKPKGRQEPQEGRRHALAVLGGQDAGRAKPEQQEELTPRWRRCGHHDG